MESDLSRAGRKKRVDVEVCLRPKSLAKADALRAHLLEYMKKNVAVICVGPLDVSADKSLAEHVERVQVYTPASTKRVPFWEASVQIHVFRLTEELGTEDMDGDGEDEAVACETLSLPARALDRVWDGLVYEPQVKDRLLQFAHTSMLFADRKVRQSLVSCNRVVLLYGPPGTGKTTLCKALAQKLAIRLSGRYPNAMLLEINAHSLFSKWFSESGKLVMKLFAKIQELVEDRDSLVCVLIDEVESLAASRQGASGEPSDAVRAVNALLTQLDKLKHFENVIVLTTSNITQAIDVAFVDRADIRQYIGLPALRARYEILSSCVQELVRAGVLRRTAAMAADGKVNSEAAYGATKKSASDKIGRAARTTNGLSGRALRRLPFKCHAFFGHMSDDDGVMEYLDFLDCLIKTAEMEISDQKRLGVYAAPSGGTARRDPPEGSPQEPPTARRRFV